MIRWPLRLILLSAFLLSSFLLYDRWQMRDPFEAMTPIDPLPRTQALVQKDHMAEAEAYLSYFVEHNSSAVTPQAHELLAAIRQRRQSWDYRTRTLIKGAIEGKSDEVEGMVGAGIADLFVVGDIRDALIEGKHWLSGEEVDEVMVALSSLGIAATAATIGTAGGSSGVRGTLSLLKQMHKGRLLPPWFLKALARLPRAADMRRESDALFAPIATLYREGGWMSAQEALRRSKSLDDLKRMQRFARTFKQESFVLMRIDPAALKLAEHYPARTITKASLYGKPGFKQLARQVKYTARISRIISKQWLSWLRAIPLWLVIGVWGVSLAGLLFSFRRARVI